MSLLTKKRALWIIPAVCIYAIVFTGCNKDDTEEKRKEELILQLTNEINSDSLRSQVQWMQNMGTRFALAPNRRNVAVSIMKRFRNMGYENARLDSFAVNKTFRGVPYSQLQYNVIASLEGSGGSDSVCIIGAHYDSYIGSGDPFISAPGANDNASGVAAAIEIARVMKKHNFEPATEIRFIAFGCEELGLDGSKAYAANGLHSIEKIRFMLNNDMIAFEPTTTNSGWRVNIIDYSNSRYLRSVAEQLCLKYTSLKPYNNNTYSNASDSYPFAQYGYKPVFFTSDIMDPKYHTINDQVTNCNFQYCREIVKLNCAILVQKN